MTDRPVPHMTRLTQARVMADIAAAQHRARAHERREQLLDVVALVVGVAFVVLIGLVIANAAAAPPPLQG